VAYRVGIDLNPVDIRDPDEALWLRALVWPEHRERMAVLESAMTLARDGPPPLLAGDATEVLPEVLAAVPEGLTVCVFHSFVLNQVHAEARERLFADLAAFSEERPLFVVSMASSGSRDAEVTLTRTAGDAWETSVLARAHPHCAWLDWVA
jgi:hypothetical protein